MYVVERETSMWTAVSHPMVSYQVETNVVTQAERPTCDIVRICLCGPTPDKLGGRPQTTVKT
jgi:hypothetical protein